LLLQRWIDSMMSIQSRLVGRKSRGEKKVSTF
jgi:hypothetical protein